jgi:hypothetical protein
MDFAIVPNFVALPRLQSLNVGRAFKSLEFSLFPSITHLAHSAEAGPSTHWMDSLSPIPSLESCQLPPSFNTEDITLFLNRAPNLKKLWVSLPFRHDDPGSIQAMKEVYPHVLYAILSYADNIFTSQAINVVNELLAPIARLEKLTHLSGLLLNRYLDVTTPCCPPIVEFFATAIPSLVYLDVMDNYSDESAYIERDGTGAYLRHTYINQDLSTEIDPTEWGNFYFGRVKDAITYKPMY